jgi:DNA repair exonuclease SbcCD ATPase subunit
MSGREVDFQSCLTVTPPRFIMRILPAVVLLSLIFVPFQLHAQEESVDADDAVRRLPPHYAEVVTEKQREQIYVLQGEYKSKLDDLVAQITTLKTERDKSIEALLTAGQLEEVKLRQEAARIRREKLAEERRLEREQEQKEELKAELDKLRKELEALKAERKSAAAS